MMINLKDFVQWKKIERGIMKKGSKINYEIIAEFECENHKNVKSIEDVQFCIYNGAPLCPQCNEEMTILDYYRKRK